jgi:hypothetical protein
MGAGMTPSHEGTGWLSGQFDLDHAHLVRDHGRLLSGELPEARRGDRKPELLRLVVVPERSGRPPATALP